MRRGKKKKIEDELDESIPAEEVLSPIMFVPGEVKGTYVRRQCVLKRRKVVRWLPDSGVFAPPEGDEKGDMPIFSPEHRKVVWYRRIDTPPAGA